MSKGSLAWKDDSEALMRKKVIQHNVSPEWGVHEAEFAGS